MVGGTVTEVPVGVAAIGDAIASIVVGVVDVDESDDRDDVDADEANLTGDD